MGKATYNHAFLLQFSVSGSLDSEAKDVTPAMLSKGLLNRMSDMHVNNEWKLGCENVQDSYEEDGSCLPSHYTVIGFHEDSGQIVAHHVEALSELSAFTAAAHLAPGMTMIVALPGHHSEETCLIFPGESGVEAETVLEQPEVFDED
ncbi:hypothetical protein [Marinimicrobium sp. ABcell2]|uniref:hypothetical protein n=1 Tax=Marinimicrobium sp. ABcell2 TaxID=3069751 RepID=UPI0027B0D06A|nr:hypothetical protein [Marinimicrobium sp. ABcell2]MDQ2077421.1 hypothetical protein [Marinimicrobium sp. ABcell2]